MKRTTASHEKSPDNRTTTRLNGVENGYEPMIDAIYLRVSTGHQTLDQQLRAIEGSLHWMGVEYPDEYTYIFEEDDKSATKYPSLRDRPKGKELMSLIDDGYVKRLIVVDFDRIWRVGVTGVTEALEITGKGVQILCTMAGGMPVDLTSADGFMFFWNKMGQAQVECMRTSERVARKQDFNLANGMTVTGKVFGWIDTSNPVHPQHGELHPDLEEQAVIRWAVDRNSGRFGQSWNSMAKMLNQKGVPTATKKGSWRASSLKRCCSSKTQQSMAHTIKMRDVKHPKLGKVRISSTGAVAADCAV